MSTQTATITAEIVASLIADGWAPTWAACTNSVSDEYGNRASIHEGHDLVSIEFEYALAGMVETMHLDASHGTHRIVAVISSMSLPPVD